MNKLYDVFQGNCWIGATLAENAEEALIAVVGSPTWEDSEDFRAVRAVNTRICSDGRSV